MTERPTDDELRQWKALCEGGAFLYDFETAGEYYLANRRIQCLIAEIEHLRREIERLEHGYWSAAMRHKILSDDVFGERE